MTDQRHTEWMAHYSPGATCLIIFVLALVLGQDEYIRPFGAAALVVLPFGALAHRITFGRWL